MINTATLDQLKAEIRDLRDENTDLRSILVEAYTDAEDADQNPASSADYYAGMSAQALRTMAILDQVDAVRFTE